MKNRDKNAGQDGTGYERTDVNELVTFFSYWMVLGGVVCGGLRGSIRFGRGDSFFILH
jgi:hypothetical protein